MTSSIGAGGLVIDNVATITANLTSGLQAIYGANINVASNSPDGQLIGIEAQAIVDLLEFIASVNAGFDPDQAIGAILDQRVAINGLSRNGGTYTVQPIDITVSTTVTLAGLDSNYSSPTATGYTVQDSSGNLFILAATTTFTAGTTRVNFRAQAIGAVSVPTNTITTPVTVVNGVTSVNNAVAAITVGVTQETDPQLRIRRQQSTSLPSTGYLNGLLGQILNLSGVTEAVLYENITDSTDANGIPAHGIWLVVAGGANSAIANTIYNSKSYGANMKGSVTYPITTASGGIFTAQWDTPIAETLYIAFSIKKTVTGFVFATSAIQNYIAANLNYGIGAFADTSEITTVAIAAIAAQGGGGVPVLMTISSDGITYTDYLTTTNPGYQWNVSARNISITVV